MAVYTKRLLTGQSLRAASVAVPPGRVWVVRDVVLWPVDTTGGEVILRIGPEGWPILIHTFPANAATSTVHEELRQAVHEGETLDFVSSMRCDILVTGYELGA